MKLPILTRRGLTVLAVLLATNVVTGLITTQVVRSHDFSEMNMNCLLNWGSIGAEFEDARVRVELPALGEVHEVTTVLRVDEEHPVTGHERAGHG